MYLAYEQQPVLEAVMRMGDANQWKPGPHIHYVDDHAIAQTYLDLARLTGDPQMVAPFRAYADLMMSTPRCVGRAARD